MKRFSLAVTGLVLLLAAAVAGLFVEDKRGSDEHLAYGVFKGGAVLLGLTLLLLAVTWRD